MDRTWPQRLLAEFVGTFALIFVGAGSIVAANSPIVEVVPGGGLVTIALAHGFVIATMVTAVGHVSGGHFNPAVTVSAWATRRIGTASAAAYVVTQLVAGVAGAALLRGVTPEGVWRASELGATVVAEGTSDLQAITIEAVLSFFLVWVIFGAAIDPEGPFARVAGLAIGLVIAMDIMMGGPFTGASMNPARSLGPDVVRGDFEGIWVYFIGPILGGTIAAVLYDLVIIRRRGVGAA